MSFTSTNPATGASNRRGGNAQGLSEASTMSVMCVRHDVSSGSETRSRRKIVDNVQRLER